MRDTAIFGGTFDPIGLNHISAIQRLARNFRTVVIAAGERNPSKSWAPAPFELRLEMIRRVLRHESFPTVNDPQQPGIFISTIRYTYTFEFVESWRNEYPQQKFVFAVGSDLADEVAGWDRWSELNAVEESPLCVLTRKAALGSSTAVRQGSIPPHPAIEPILSHHRLYQ